jgi:hypothetical protein
MAGRLPLDASSSPRLRVKSFPKVRGDETGEGEQCGTCFPRSSGKGGNSAHILTLGRISCHTPGDSSHEHAIDSSSMKRKVKINHSFPAFGLIKFDSIVGGQN